MSNDNELIYVSIVLGEEVLTIPIGLIEARIALNKLNQLLLASNKGLWQISTHIIRVDDIKRIIAENTEGEQISNLFPFPVPSLQPPRTVPHAPGVPPGNSPAIPYYPGDNSGVHPGVHPGTGDSPYGPYITWTSESSTTAKVKANPLRPDNTRPTVDNGST